MAKFFTFFIFALLFVVNICAQSPKANPTVLINDFVFDDPKSGISELVKAYDKIETEFAAEIKALNSMAFENAKRNQELANRINSTSGCIGNTNDLLKEREKSSQEHKQKIEDGKRRFDKRYSAIISPVLEKVDLVLKEFEKVKEYIVIKRSSLPEYICSDPNLDKTAEFVAFYNNYVLVK